ncbi:MAG: ABC transporter substrate-binding protein [Comamonadaceae bacterium]|nr:MAG: ABC transporter substrate-binding protein [Comamonadaceae bacterium]
MSRVALAIAGAGVLLAAMPARAQISDDVVRIGVMADQTGTYSGNGGPGSSLAVRMAVEDFGGKVLGKPIEVVTADDQNKPNIGINMARQWIESEKFDTIVGGSSSSIAFGVSTMMKEKKKPYLIAGTVSSDLTGKQCSPMNVQFIVDTYQLANAGVTALLKQGVKSFFFITVDYAFGAALQSDATRFIEAGGGKVVGSVRHPLGASDYSSYLLQAQASKAEAIVVLNAGLDLTNALKQAAEYKLARGGQKVGVFGMTINSVSAMGLDVAQGLQITAPFYWDRDAESRAWAKRFMDKNNGVIPTYIQAGAYSAAMHYLKAVRDAGTDEGVAVMAKMKATPVNDFSMKNAKIREDGQLIRPTYPMEVKKPSESKGKYDLYKVGPEIPGDQVFRPMADGGCDFVAKK